MSLKKKSNAIRQARKPGRFVIPGYDGNDVLNTLFSYVDELESALVEAKKPAPKKAPAKKAPAKKAPAKKKS